MENKNLKKKNEEEIKDRKFNILVILLLLVICISIGYAMLSTTLYINGTTIIDKPSWDVHYENLEKVSGSVSAIEEASLDNAKANISYKVYLKEPGDFYEFTVDIVNEGSLDAMIGKILTIGLSEKARKYVEYKVTYANGTPLNEKDALKAGTKEKIKVKVRYKDDFDEVLLEQTELSLVFQVNYIQDDGTSNAVK